VLLQPGSQLWIVVFKDLTLVKELYEAAHFVFSEIDYLIILKPEFFFEEV
jgi:hypothetical protein